MKKLLILILFVLMSFFLNAAYYGAIAINQQTGATGYSYDYSSRYAAERTALNHSHHSAAWPGDLCPSQRQSR